MASYDLVFKKSVAKDLRSIPKTDVGRILKRIEALRDDPRAEGCIKLSAQERYRVRQGAYRIIYEIYENDVVIMVVKVAHRSTMPFTRTGIPLRSIPAGDGGVSHHNHQILRTIKRAK